MPTVNANKHTAHDLQLAGQMRREDYKTISTWTRRRLRPTSAACGNAGMTPGIKPPLSQSLRSCAKPQN